MMVLAPRDMYLYRLPEPFIQAIVDGTQTTAKGGLMNFRALFLLFLCGLSFPAHSDCTPGLSKELTFSDGSKACLENFEPLNLDIGTNIAAQARSAKTHSYAIPAPGSKCVASSGWSWNSSDDDRRAVAFCEEVARKKAEEEGLQDRLNCKCFAIAPVSGKVDLAQKEFVSLLFSNSYGLLDQHTSSVLFGWKVRGIKKDLQEKEQLHYQRLAKLKSPRSASPAKAGEASDQSKPSLDQRAEAAMRQRLTPPENLSTTSPLQPSAPTVAANAPAPENDLAVVPESSGERRQEDPAALSLARLQDSCADVQYPDKIGVEAIFYELEANRLEEANRKATGIPSQGRSAAFLACLIRVQTWLGPQLSAYRENKARLAAETTEREKKRQQERDDPVKGCRLLVLQFGERFAFQVSPKCQEVLAKVEADKPAATRLEEVYGTYLLVRDCYEVRKEFRTPYVTRGQFDTARAVTRRREQALVKQFPDLKGQKDGIWNATKQKYVQAAAITTSKYNQDVHDLCRRALATYTSDEGQRASDIKKDF